VRVGADIGGTYTDVVLYDDREHDVRTAKVLSTPGALDSGVRQAISEVAPTLSEVRSVVHGSTIAINALIERSGARTALLTTEGFRDVYEIGRINRPDSFNPHFRKHRTLVPREDVFEVSERLLFDGTIRRELDETDARSLALRLEALGYESVAIVFLHAYRFPDHELRMARIIREHAPEMFVTCSHELTREYREYERTSTTVANAFIGPKVGGYLSRLEAGLRRDGFGGDLLLLQSNGGVTDATTARHQPIGMLESGPAGGIVAAHVVCELLGIDAAVCFDMGGTTSKASVVRSSDPGTSVDYFLGGYNEGLVIRIPALEVVEVGTGGGSVVWQEGEGSVHVGPRSAGAIPGPAAYGRGGREPTVTDANVVLGWLRSGRRFGGEVALDREAAEAALARGLADPLGVSVTRAAAGILEVASAQIANAVRQVTLQRGLDPRDFALVAYGGAGPLHASAVARELGMGKVIVPRLPGYFSALGMLLADLRREVVQTVFVRLADADLEQLESAFRELEAQATAGLGRSAEEAQALWVERAADMRYVGQEHTVTVSLPGALPGGEPGRDELRKLFDQAHELRYSHSASHEGVDVVSLRVAVVGRLAKPRLPEVGPGDGTPVRRAAPGGEAVIVGPSGEPRAPVLSRGALHAGDVLDGPAVIEEEGSTTLVEDGDRATVDRYGHLVIEVGAR
jgi:N-methylhydantoinase A